MIAISLKRGNRHGIDSFGTNQRIDVKRIAVFGIFGASGRPQHSLHARTFVRQCLEPAPEKISLNFT